MQLVVTSMQQIFGGPGHVGFSSAQWSVRNQCICMHACNRLTALCSGLPRWAGTRKVKPIWILLEQETASGSGISWAICMSAPGSRQITTSALHHSVFTGRMPFLPPNQQRQSTEGNKSMHLYTEMFSLIFFMVTWLQCPIKALNIAYGNSFSNQCAFTMLEAEVLKYNFLTFYIAKTVLCILLKFVQLTLNK